jgi:hypothetical protein
MAFVKLSFSDCFPHQLLSASDAKIQFEKRLGHPSRYEIQYSFRCDWHTTTAAQSKPEEHFLPLPQLDCCRQLIFVPATAGGSRTSSSTEQLARGHYPLSHFYSFCGTNILAVFAFVRTGTGYNNFSEFFCFFDLYNAVLAGTGAGSASYT